MVIDMGYWSKVFKRIFILILTILGIYLAFKLAIFYMPFLIAFIISLLIEPLIKFIMKKTKLKRKITATLILIAVFAIIVGLLVWGITTLISEAAKLLQDLNGYFEIVYNKAQQIISSIDFDRLKISEDVTKIIQSSAMDFLSTLSNWIKNILTSILNGITSIPTIAIYVVVSLLSLYFISADKIYILDQIEHHLPETWVKRLGKHLRELIKALGNYLKAEATLIIISFVISLIGLYTFKFIGLNIQFPLLVALAIGFVDALPILGSGTVMVPWAIITSINGDLKLGISILTLWIIMSVVRQIIEPKIVSTHIGIHPIFTLIAMYTGFRFMGLIGMLIGPIILIILKNIFGALIDKGVMKAIFDR